MRRTRVYIDSMLSVAAACIGLKMWLPSARIACDHLSPVDILLRGSAFRNIAAESVFGGKASLCSPNSTTAPESSSTSY